MTNRSHLFDRPTYDMSAGKPTNEFVGVVMCLV